MITMAQYIDREAGICVFGVGETCNELLQQRLLAAWRQHGGSMAAAWRQHGGDKTCLEPTWTTTATRSYNRSPSTASSVVLNNRSSIGYATRYLGSGDGDDGGKRKEGRVRMKQYAGGGETEVRGHG